MDKEVLDELINVDLYDLALFEKAYGNYYSSLEKLYTDCFPKAKKYSDNDITNQITKQLTSRRDSDIKNWVKYQLVCLMKSSVRIFNKIEDHKRSKPSLVKIQIGLLKEYATDCKHLLTQHLKLEGVQNDLVIDAGKRYVIEPSEIISNSMSILRSSLIEDNLGYWGMRYCSVFLIRQAIEVYMKNVFGIASIKKLNGELIKLNPEYFIDFIDDARIKNSFPIQRKTLKNIHSWTQTYIHGGIIPYAWQIEWNQNMLEPMLCNYHTNVKVERTCIIEVEQKIREQYKEDVEIVRENPWKYAWINEDLPISMSNNKN